MERSIHPKSEKAVYSGSWVVFNRSQVSAVVEAAGQFVTIPAGGSQTFSVKPVSTQPGVSVVRGIEVSTPIPTRTTSKSTSSVTTASSENTKS